MTQSMKDALKGEGGGLQSMTGVAGEILGNNTDTRSGEGAKSDDASKSLGQFGKGGGGNTTAGTSVKGEDQVKNMQSGSADHLELGMRKET